MTGGNGVTSLYLWTAKTKYLVAKVRLMHEQGLCHLQDSLEEELALEWRCLDYSVDWQGHQELLRAVFEHEADRQAFRTEFEQHCLANAMLIIL
jgi:hypothetical protein